MQILTAGGPGVPALAASYAKARCLEVVAVPPDHVRHRGNADEKQAGTLRGRRALRCRSAGVSLRKVAGRQVTARPPADTSGRRPTTARRADRTGRSARHEFGGGGARMLWLRTALFTILVPGTELVLVPLAVVLLDLGPRIELGPACYAGLVPLLAGLAVILRCFADFIHCGRGTPAIYDPPRELVVAGLYRYVRNPQYVGVVLVILGEALLTGRIVLYGYAALMAAGYHLFVRYYEEPTLGRVFGEPYARYREAVPRWLPRRPGRTGRRT